MKNQGNSRLNKHVNNFYSCLYEKLNSEILFNEQNNLKKENKKLKEDINSQEYHLIKEKEKDSFINEEKSSHSSTKRSYANSLFSDESLANNFTFHLSIHDNPIYSNKKEKTIYERRFNDDDYNSKCSFIDFPFLMDKKNQNNENKFNFGEDPYSIYKKLNNQINEGFITNETKYEILNFIKNVYNFPVFKFKSSIKNAKNNELIIQNCNDNSQINENIDSLFKNIVPVKHIYNVPIIIENNQLTENRVNDENFYKVNSDDSSSNDNNMYNYKLIQDNKTFSKAKHKLKANNEKSIIYKKNTKFTICLDEINFDDDNIRNKHFSKKIKRDKRYYIKLNNE